MAEIISSSTNSIIKLARSLKQKKSRSESDLFLVEGILHVGEAVSSGWDIQSIMYCPEKLKSDYGLKLITQLTQQNVKCQKISASAFETFAEKENPQGIAAIVKQRHSNFHNISAFKLLVAIVSPQDPGNIGSILRTIDAVGADGLILLDGGVDPYHPSAVRASMGSVFWVPFYSAQFNDFFYWTKENHFRVIGTSAHAKNNLADITLDSRSTILMFGSEQKGLQTDQINICSELVSLPMRGHATSLNLAVSAGVFLYQLKG